MVWGESNSFSFDRHNENVERLSSVLAKLHHRAIISLINGMMKRVNRTETMSGISFHKCFSRPGMSDGRGANFTFEATLLNDSPAAQRPQLS